MPKGYDSHSVCMCVCLCLSATTLAAVYLIHTLKVRCCSNRPSTLISTYAHYVDFIENALFRSSGDICWLPRPSLLLDQLTMDKRDSDGIFSRRLVCRTSDSTCNSTDSSLITVDYKQRFLACNLMHNNYYWSMWVWSRRTEGMKIETTKLLTYTSTKYAPVKTSCCTVCLLWAPGEAKIQGGFCYSIKI